MRRISAEVVYLGLATTFGLFFIVLTPPFQAPDEGNHFLRAYQLSNLGIIGEKQGATSGGTLPTALLAEPHRLDRLPFHPEAHTSALEILNLLRHSPRFGSARMGPPMFAEFPNTVRYSPAPYVPLVAAIALARWLGLTVVAGVYLCRVFACATAIGLTWAALRLMPESLKWPLASLALLPMGLFITSMATPDAVIISLSYFTFGLAAWLRANPTRAVRSFPILASIAVCIAGLALSKVVYFLIPAALAIALFNRVRSWLARAALLAAVLGAALALDLAWLAVVESIRTPPIREFGIDPAGQFRIILHDPMVFVRVVQADLSRHALRYYDSFIGKLGYLDVMLPRWALTGFTVCLVWFGVTRARGDAAAARFTVSERVLLLAIPIVTIVLMMVLQYLDWLPVGAEDLRGVLQGRHLYPVAPAVLLAASRIALPEWWARARPVVFVAAYATGLIVTAMALLGRYYG
jgi:uncharacterized membrane protein